MKIFEFDYGSAKDWVVAENEEDAAKELTAFTGSSEWEKVTVMSELALDHGGIVDIDDGWYDEDQIPDGEEDKFLNGYRLIKSFRKAVEDAKISGKPEYLASTEW